MKALVLGGGGAKGSYEVGVWKALNKPIVILSFIKTPCIRIIP